MPDAQSVSLAHAVLHAVPAPLQVYAPHENVVPATQVPDPLQEPAAVALPPLQVAAEQLVPDGYNEHAPAPLQLPVWPHDDADEVAHSLSGSVLSAMAPQVPLLPPPFFAAEHASQTPPHDVLQHTPSTQLPELQLFAVLQAAPTVSFARHAPPEQ